MSTSRHLDRVCAIVLALTLVLTALFMNGKALGLTSAARTLGYETRLFDTSKVHTVDIVMDDWDAFLDTCEDEEYSPCAVVIDGEAYKNVGIRGKGNTSLSTVARMDSDRYSFKLEFDCYEAGKSYYGLDKLCLNNLIQDNTMMKDYLTYQMMAQSGAAAPLCSFVYIRVNGEDWGLYLAVEGIEDSFLLRNYGTAAGELYKPDSMDFGGGRGNGKGFDMENMGFGNQMPAMPDGQNGQMPTMPDGQNGQTPTMPDGQNGQAPAMPDGQNGQMPTAPNGQNGGLPAQGQQPDGFFPGGIGGGMGSDDVKLKYSGDDPDSYSNIFSSAKTEVTDADKSRLIAALKALGEGDTSNLDMEAVLRYFVVHNFVVNADSYTGSMIHNYYLYEQDGRLSMLPWDYNLAFGTFQGGDAAGAVNDPIDSPLSVSGDGDRPMADWIFQNETYTALYHQYFAEFLERVDPAAIIDGANALIAPYVEKDPTKFCTYEQFEAGVAALKSFCALRAESVSGQLAGTIPSTDEGQAADGSDLVDASGLDLSAMGTMGGGGEGNRQALGSGESPDSSDETPAPQEGDAFPAFGPMGGGNRPDAGNWNPQGQDGGSFSPPSGNVPGEGASGAGIPALVLTGASVLVLLAGLAFAYRFRRYGEARPRRRS